MKWFIYNLLFPIGYLLMLPKFIFRMWKRGGYSRNFLQRIGIYAPETVEKLGAKSHVWIHGVSVGEIQVTLRFAEQIRSERPGTVFVITTTTSTGYRIAESRLSKDDILLYFPSDFPSVIKKVVSLVKPEAVILAESEIWPNFIRTLRRKGIPVILVNGRMSDSSFRGYMRLKFFFSEVLRCFDLMLVQTRTDRERLLALGVEDSRVFVTGSMKYDMQVEMPDSAKTANLLGLLGAGLENRIITCGSTWPGEESVILEAYRDIKSRYQAARLVLVPRHVERASEIEALIRSKGFECVRWSALKGGAVPGNRSESVVLVDTTGELMQFYSIASVVFVGKSLCEHGGQNIIEPAVFGRPIITGPNMENFRQVTDDFLGAEAIVQIDGVDELKTAIDRMLADQAYANEIGKRARELVDAKKGLLRNSTRQLLKCIPSRG